VDFGRAVEGTENRINYARDEYNGSVKTYNTHIRSFFASMFLNREEFPKKEGFKAKKGSEDTPDFELE
jgi:LemA protein